MSLNILFIIPSLRRAGAEMQMVELLNGIDNKKFNKFLFCFENERDLLPQLDEQNIKFSCRPRNYKFDFSMVTNIANIIDNHNIDLVYCSLNISLLMGWLGVKKSNKKPPITYAIHSTINKSHKDELFDMLIYQWLMRSCSKILFVCNNQMNYWKDKYSFLKNGSLVVHNGVDTKVFDPNNFLEFRESFRQDNNIPVDAIILTSIAAFRPEKGHNTLLKTFSSLLSHRKNCYLFLAGDGPERYNIETYIQEHDLEDNIILLGNVKNVKPVLAATDMTILASTTEAFSMAMLESMAMGVPVVATDIGGASEAILPGKTGCLAQPGSSESLLNGIKCLLLMFENGEKEEISRQCRELITEKYTKTQMVEKTEEILFKMINSN